MDPPAVAGLPSAVTLLGFRACGGGPREGLKSASCRGAVKKVFCFGASQHKLYN